MIGNTSIECGCGFIVQGPDQAQNRDAYAEHECSSEELPVRWHESAFSFWGWLMVLSITSAIIVTVAGR